VGLIRGGHLFSIYEMAFRIHDCVVRGQIDNRIRGRVTGKVWLAGGKDPLELDLKGNACRDLAGCRLEFVNRKTAVMDRTTNERLAAMQRGGVGDITASRKIRVLDVPTLEAYQMAKRGEKAPEHMANCLYIEWFSEANGRVVIESADFELKISTPEWVFTEEDEAARAEQAAGGMKNFVEKLSDAVNAHKRGQKSPEERWDEFDYEKFLKESDARNEKYRELLEKYGDEPGADEKIDAAMGWNQGGMDEERVAELNAMFEESLENPEPEPEPDPAREGIDWIRTEDGKIRHPLQHRCSAYAIKYWQQVDELGLGDWDDRDVEQFVAEFQITSTKLAGALESVARDEPFFDAGFTIALLKRALSHLHLSQAGLEALANKKVLNDEIVSEARKDLFEVREGILRLMDELRGRA
jgi:hypothetical protein